jgi:hypothetical protein
MEEETKEKGGMEDGGKEERRNGMEEETKETGDIGGGGRKREQGRRETGGFVKQLL